jgi:hypothetical protein
LPDRITVNDEDIHHENDAFIYTKKIESQGKKTIILTYSYKTKQKEVNPGEFKNICNDVNKIIRNLPLQISYPVDNFVYENRINLYNN